MANMRASPKSWMEGIEESLSENQRAILVGEQAFERGGKRPESRASRVTKTILLPSHLVGHHP